MTSFLPVGSSGAAGRDHSRDAGSAVKEAPGSGRRPAPHARCTPTAPGPQPAREDGTEEEATL